MLNHPLVLLALAVAPGIALTIFFYVADKYEKEPKKLLAYLFFSGMFSIVPAIYLTGFFESIGFKNDDTFLGVFLYSFGAVAISEELSKFYFYWRIGFNKSDFNEPYDGILYSVMVSLGFATLENILYVYDYGFSTGVLRMFSAVPAHAMFGVMMGYFGGLARFNSNKNLLLFIGLLTAIFFHGAYDFFLIKENVPFLFIGAIVSLYVGIRLALKAIKQHQENSPFK